MLDHSITSDSGKTDEGMVERLESLRSKLLPKTLLLASDQARIASPIEDKEEDIQAKQLKILNNIFDKIKENNPAAAREMMKTYINETRPAVITNKKFFSDLLLAIPLIYYLLIIRCKELKDECEGIQANQYCITTIGMIGTTLSFALRKRLRGGVFYFLHRDKNLERALDVSDPNFLGRPGSNRELGVSCFYDSAELAWSVRDIDFAALHLKYFSNFYKQLFQQSTKTYAAIEYSDEEQHDGSLSRSNRL